VHIEVADSNSFINALRRFICRRRSVKEIRCGFGAEAEPRRAVKEIDDKDIKAKLLEAKIDWIKKPASASNFCGVWERQSRSIRNIMNGLIKEHGSRLDSESLRTFNDSLSAPPLSPSMLLTGKTRLVLPPPGEFKKEKLHCRKRSRRTQHLAKEF